MQFNINMAKELLCFADDTTGALDVAGSFHTLGYITDVFIESDYEQSQEADCVVHNLNTRNSSSEKSRASIRDIIRHFGLSKLSSSNLFYKVDSTLRGNILDDIDSINRELPNRPVFLASAFPFYKRSCIGGTYYVKGIPILDTEFSRDQAFFYKTSALSDNRGDIKHIDWQILSQGSEAIVQEVRKSNMHKFTFDTRHQLDLEIIAQAGLKLGAVLVGSSGLARALPKRQKLPNKAFKVVNKIPTLFVIGSLNSLTRIQEEKLETAGISSIKLLPQQIGVRSQLQIINEKVRNELVSGSSVIVATPEKLIIDRGIGKEVEESITVATNVVNVPHNLVIVGGETARATFKGRHIKRLRVRGEFEIGIPITSVSNKNEAIITKAGGFGYGDSLINIHRFLKN